MDTIPSYFFRRPTRSHLEINYGNTVLVECGNGERWLGYLQDIDRDLMLIDFDCSTVAAEWIHSRHVRAQPFLNDDWTLWRSLDQEVASTGSCGVQVALRRTENGPFIFRPARLLTRTAEVGLFYVRLKDTAPHQYVVIHLWQVAANMELAVDEPPLRKQTRGLYYRKFTVPFQNAHMNGTLNMEALRKCLYNAGLEKYQRGPNSVPGDERIDFRIFARIIGGNLHFICARHPEGRAHWNKDTLLQAYASCYPAPSVLGDVMEDPQQKSVFDNSGWIGGMALPIMADVLISLDMHTQAKAKKVCTLWWLLLSDIRISRHVTIDSSAMVLNKLSMSMCDDVYSLTWGLNRAITGHTESLMVLDNVYQSNLTTITTMLVTLSAVKKIQLRYILIRNGRTREGIK
ncbi:uncharacterized protein LOC129596666 [Paramacrobiotus metropolitanus]|uniref:uncharacterized protein LOC129596666 n=1 Tax=Paramacrobiotus metropolitanus TaxID=2943436 RepID=UPI00244564C9|nr:uncharacterized protein LOC129596666 [Paramacrobiotus metropolitanus]